MRPLLSSFVSTSRPSFFPVVNPPNRLPARVAAPLLLVGSLVLKGPIPGTPVVVADWKEQEQDQEGRGHGHGGDTCSSVRPVSGRNGRAESDQKRGGEDDGKTPPIEKEHVLAVYDTIAPHWCVIYFHTALSGVDNVRRKKLGLHDYLWARSLTGRHALVRASPAFGGGWMGQGNKLVVGKSKTSL